MREISVYWWQGVKKVKIANLVEVTGKPIMLEWDQDFLEQKDLDLSPLRFKKVTGLIECPKEPFNGLPGLLADHIPDGWGRILLKIGLDKKGLSTEDISPLDAMAYLGEKGMGALTFEPSMELSDCWAAGKISLRELERGIEPILEGSASSVIEAFLENGASPNGIRPKIILKEKDGVFYSASNKIQGDEWIIKFKSKEDPVGIGRLEYVYSLMAKAAGIDMPETRLFQKDGGAFFAVRRFDRSDDGGRIHVHTLSGILHASPGNFSVGYEHFAKVAQHLTKDSRQVEKVFRLAAFNVFSSNQDDHSKNVAFLMSKDGKWSVAPAYDLTFHRTKFSEHKMLVMEKGRPGDQDLVEFAQNFGIPKHKAVMIIDQIKTSIGEFSKLAKEFDLPKTLTIKIAEVLESTLSKKKKPRFDR